MGQGNPYELDVLGAIKTGFEIGTKIQDNRQRKLDQARIIQMNNERLYLERQQENRLRDAQEQIINERELDRTRRSMVDEQTSKYAYDVNDLVKQGFTALEARAEVDKRYPLAKQTGESVDEFLPPRITPFSFDGKDAAVVGKTVVRNPGMALDPSAVRTAEALADAKIQSGQAAEEDRSAIVAGALERKDATVRRSEQVADSMIKAGFLEPAQRDKTVAEMNQNGGKILRPNETTLLKLGERVGTIEMADQLDKDLNSFDQKFGKGSLDAYIGQFDAPLDKALDLMRKRKSPQDVEALRIFQTFADIKNGKIKTVSGATVTKDEGKRADAAIGSVLNKNFVNQFRNFRANEKSTFKATVDTLEGYKLPKNVLAAAGGPVEVEASVSVTPVRVTSQADLDKVPEGAQFIDDSGKVKVKRSKKR